MTVAEIGILPVL